MNTSAAAAEAQVTIATIRTWCRLGVIAAVKQAGRWIIDTASLAHRITIGAMKRRQKEAAVPALDLTATYTIDAGPHAGTLITPQIKERSRNGKNLIIVTGLAPLLADHINAIADSGDRLHAIETLMRAQIVISDQPRDLTYPSRDEGRLVTTYYGTRDLPVDVVLDLAEQIRDHKKGA